MSEKGTLVSMTDLFSPPAPGTMIDEFAVDARVDERLLLDVERVAPRIHVGAEDDARLAFEILVEFAFGRDCGLAVRRLAAREAQPVGFVYPFDMVCAVGVDVDVERVRIGLDDELFFQCTQFDEVDVLGVDIGAGSCDSDRSGDAPKLEYRFAKVHVVSVLSLLFFRSGGRLSSAARPKCV